MVRGATSKSISEFLGTVGIPVMVLDGAFKVVDMNGMAESALHTTTAEAQGSSVGVAISCHNAGLPGGCGASENCPGCQLRRYLMATYTDGRPRFSQISRLEIEGKGEARPVQFRFSTEKVGGVVVLMIEDMAESREAS